MRDVDDRRELHGWAFLSTEEVDFWTISRTRLQLLEEEQLYPPRFEGTAATTIKFYFNGGTCQTELYCTSPMH